MPILRLDNVSLAYGHLPLLSQVDFQVDLGERVCIVGRNGAGKTTFGKKLAKKQEFASRQKRTFTYFCLTFYKTNFTGMLKKIGAFFFSTRLMAFLFIAFAPAMAFGTFIENDYNTATARILTV